MEENRNHTPLAALTNLLSTDSGDTFLRNNIEDGWMDPPTTEDDDKRSTSFYTYSSTIFTCSSSDDDDDDEIVVEPMEVQDDKVLPAAPTLPTATVGVIHDPPAAIHEKRTAFCTTHTNAAAAAAAAAENEFLEEPSPATRLADTKNNEPPTSTSLYSNGDRVFYKGSTLEGPAAIVKVHYDSQNIPFYTIRLDEQTGERQTEANRLTSLRQDNDDDETTTTDENEERRYVIYSNYSQGDRVLYGVNTMKVTATILKVHRDGQNVPFFTIRFDDGSERQTEANRLTPLLEENESTGETRNRSDPPDVGKKKQQQQHGEAEVNVNRNRKDKRSKRPDAPEGKERGDDPPTKSQTGKNDSSPMADDKGVWGVQRYIGKETWRNSWGSFFIVGPLGILCLVCNKLDTRPVFRSSGGKYFTQDGKQVRCASRDFAPGGGHAKSVNYGSRARCTISRADPPSSKTNASTFQFSGNGVFSFCPSLRDCPCNDLNRPFGTQCDHNGCLRCAIVQGNNNMNIDSFVSKAMKQRHDNANGGTIQMCSNHRCQCNEPYRMNYSQCYHQGCRRCALMNGDKDMAVRAIAAEALGVKGCGSTRSPCHRYGCPACALVRAGGSGFGGNNFGGFSGPMFGRNPRDNFSGVPTGPFGLNGQSGANPNITMCENHMGYCPCNEPNRHFYGKCGHHGCIRCALAYGDKDKASRALAAAHIMNDGRAVTRRCPRAHCSCNSDQRGVHTPCHHDGCTRCAMVDAGGSGAGFSGNWGNTARPDRFFEGPKSHFGGFATDKFGLGNAGGGLGSSLGRDHGRFSSNNNHSGIGTGLSSKIKSKSCFGGGGIQSGSLSSGIHGVQSGLGRHGNW